MKIKDYNDAIEFFRTNDYQAADGAWSEFYQSEVLEPRIMDQAALVDDLEPGSLKDELLNDFDPSQETYEEYLQRKRLGERPFNMAEGGMIGKPGGIVEPGVKYYGKYIPHSSPKDKVVLPADAIKKIKNKVKLPVGQKCSTAHSAACKFLSPFHTYIPIIT